MVAGVDDIGKHIPIAEEATVAIIKHPPPLPVIGLPAAEIVGRPVDIGGIQLEDEIIDEIIHVDFRAQVVVVLGLRQVGGLHPVIKIAPFRIIAFIQGRPILDDIATIGVDVIMVLQLTPIRRLFHIIDTPILTIQEDGNGTGTQNIDIQ